MSDISPFHKILNLLYMPVIFGVILVSWLVSDGLNWMSLLMFGLFVSSCTMILYEWMLEKTIKKYQDAIDDGLVMFEGSVWAKTYWKLGTAKARLQREIRRRERAGA